MSHLHTHILYIRTQSVTLYSFEQIISFLHRFYININFQHAKKTAKIKSKKDDTLAIYLTKIRNLLHPHYILKTFKYLCKTKKAYFSF